jgi:hypothetical protein
MYDNEIMNEWMLHFVNAIVILLQRIYLMQAYIILY